MSTKGYMSEYWLSPQGRNVPVVQWPDGWLQEDLCDERGFMKGWIRVEDKLPPGRRGSIYSKRVLVGRPGEDHILIATCCIDNGQWYDFDNPSRGRLDGVTHWRPLPNRVRGDYEFTCCFCGKECVIEEKELPYDGEKWGCPACYGEV